MKIIKHIKRWNVWRKHNVNSKLHKILVLFGIIKSPTLVFTLIPEEYEEIQKAIEEAIENAKKEVTP